MFAAQPAGATVAALSIPLLQVWALALTGQHLISASLDACILVRDFAPAAVAARTAPRRLELGSSGDDSEALLGSEDEETSENEDTWDEEEDEEEEGTSGEEDSSAEEEEAEVAAGEEGEAA